MKIFLLTGGAGFIGSHLAESLTEQGHMVINIDNFNDFYSPAIKKQNISSLVQNKNHILHKTDIRNIKELDEIFAQHSIDTVIHLAAMAGVRPSIENPLLYEEVNIRGTMNILECMKKYGVKKFVFASSSSVYGNNKKLPFKETDNVNFAISPYAATKKSCEVLCHTYHHLYDINMVLLRFFTVYGPRQRPDLAIHKFTKLIVEGKEIPFFGDGSTQRDYTYIGDIIDGVLKSINFVASRNKLYEIFNLGESQTINLKEMVSTIEETLGIKAQIKQLEMRAGDVIKTYASILKAKEMIGYKPQTDFKEGISKFVEWYKSNKN